MARKTYRNTEALKPAATVLCVLCFIRKGATAKLAATIIVAVLRLWQILVVLDNAIIV